MMGIIAKVKKLRNKLIPASAGLALVGSAALPFAETTTAPSLTLSFDFAQMFTWTQSILNAMMPVVYITLGISLAFVIIRALKGAFA